MGDIKKGGLAKKLLAVLSAVERIPKNGENKFHNYKYVTESDMVDYLRPKLAEVGVMVWTNVAETIITDRTTSKGNPERIARVALEMTFEDAETGEERTVRFYGEGADASDKCVYKAITGAEKYALMKTFLVSTGDDPEHEEKGHASPSQQVHAQMQKPAQAAIAKQQAQMEEALNKGALAPNAPAVQPPKPGFKVMAGSEGWPVYWVYAIYKPAPGQSKYDIYLADSMKVGGSSKKGLKHSIFVDPSKPEESERIQTIEAAYASNSPLRYSVKTNVKGDKTYHNIVDVSVIPAAALNELPNDPEPPGDEEPNF
jgi:hypothetical protein